MRRVTHWLAPVALTPLLALAPACGKKAPPPATSAPTVATVAPPDASAPAPATTPAEADAAPAIEADAAPAIEADAAVAPAPAAEADAGSAPSPEAAPTPAPGRDEAALAAPAKALVEAWVGAQNHADFDAYAAFYAPRFTGIKRSGPREKRFAHDGWLADRKKMFKQAMTVTADDVAVTSAGDAVVVRFVQTWASGTYQDKGPKQLVLVSTPGGLRIAREEMLTSELLTGDAAPKALAPATFSLVIAAGQDAYVALADAPDDAWATGQPTLVAKTGPTTLVRATDAAKLPDAVKAWVGKKVTTSEGCAGTIDRVDLVGRFEPHFGTVQRWNGTGDAEPAGKPLTDAEIAADAWTGGAEVLVGAHIAGCTGGTWVRDTAAPAALAFAPAAADAKRDAAALAEFRKLSGWKAIQADSKTYDPPVATATWDVFDGAAPVVATWSDAASGRTFVQVTAQAGNGCGQFGGAFGAVFEVKQAEGKATFVLMTDPEGGPTAPIANVVDVDGDGDVELILDQGLIQKAGGVWKQTVDLTPPNYDCPC